MKTITINEAAKKLNMTRLTVQVLLQYEKLPIGYAIKNPGSTRFHYVVYEELVDKYIRSVEGDE